MDLSDYTIRIYHNSDGAEATLRRVQNHEGVAYWRVLINAVEVYANLDQETAIQTAVLILTEMVGLICDRCGVRRVAKRSLTDITSSGATDQRCLACDGPMVLL